MWYAALTAAAAWAEFFRHWASEEISPFEIRRRIGRARVRSLRVLDLTDPIIRDCLGVAETMLVSDDLSTCQALGDYARQAGYDGILAPSGALEGATILAIFISALDKVRGENSRIQTPPSRLRAVARRLLSPLGY